MRQGMTAPRSGEFSLAGARWLAEGWLPQPLQVAGVAALAILLGVAAAFQPVLALVAIIGILMLSWMLVMPVRGAYLLALLVPLVVGMNRGMVVPVLRPNELLLLLALGLGVVYATVGPANGRVKLGPFTVIDRTFGLLFVFGSLMPLAVLLFRSGAPSSEDTFQLLTLIKLYLGYRVVLALVQDERQMLTILRLMLAASVVVALVGLLQVSRAFDFHELLATYYSAGQVRESLELRRATSTLGVWQATGLYLSVHAAMAVALLMAGATWRARPWLIAALVIDVLGALGTLTLTAVVALPLGLGILAIMGRRVRLTLAFGLAAVALALVALWPAIEERWNYQFFQYGTALALPLSWEGRIQNLTTVFIPEIMKSPLFGVAPSASPDLAWRFAENQIMYLLYQGGLLYAAAYLLFMYVVLRTLWRWSKQLTGPASAVARTGFIAWLLMLVLGLFDPHLTMPGEAEAAWMLLALTAGAATRAGQGA